MNGTTYTDGDTIFDFDVLGVIVMMPMPIYMVVLTLMVMDTVLVMQIATITIHDQ